VTVGLAILVRSMSLATSGFANGNSWQYHPRSDRHSKILCWGIFFDLMLRDSPISRQVREGKVAFGINHRMRDFQNSREKDLDLVICRRASQETKSGIAWFQDMVQAYSIVLGEQEATALATLPLIPLTGVQTSLVALEAKAAMTEFGKARPRLYDELNSSQLTIHGDTQAAIAAGFVIVNVSPTFVSPLRNPFKLGAEYPTIVTSHTQMRSAASVIEKIEQLPRRSAVDTPGFDALGVALVSCANDGTPVTIETASPAPRPGDSYHYDSFLERIETIYAARFASL